MAITNAVKPKFPGSFPLYWLKGGSHTVIDESG